MENQAELLTAFIYYDFQYQASPTEPTIWSSIFGTWRTREEALVAAVAYEQETGRPTRLIQVELYRSVL